jgi:PAS domain S-box-containing protein
MVLAADGTPVRMIGVCEDVSAEVRAREASDRLVSLVECSHDAIFTCTLDGVITSWNPAAEQLYGLAGAEAIGASVELLAADGALSGWLERNRAVARSGQSVHEEIVRRTPGGEEVELSVVISPVRDHNDVAVGVADSARDIGDTRKLELSELRRRRAIDLNDTVVQSLVLARYRLATDPDDARRSLAQAIAQCQRIVDELLDGDGDAGTIQPGSLRREPAPPLS